MRGSPSADPLDLECGGIHPLTNPMHKGAAMFLPLLQCLHGSGFSAIPPRWPCNVLLDLGYGLGCTAAPHHRRNALRSSGSKGTPPKISCTARGAVQPARKPCHALYGSGL